MTINDHSEWLEADGLGGFASGTSSGVRTRRYHAVLLAATMPPTGRVVLVNGFDAWIDSPTGALAMSTQLPSQPVSQQKLSTLQKVPANPPAGIYEYQILMLKSGKSAKGNSNPAIIIDS